MIELILLLVLTVIAAGVGRSGLSLVGVACTSLLEEGVFSIALGYGVVAYLMFGVGIIGLLDRRIICGFLILLAAASVPGLRQLSRVKMSARGPTTVSRERLSSVLGVLLLGAMGLNFMGALAPVSSVDALAYHLALPKIWIGAGRITELPWHWVSYQPLTVEMLFLLGTLLYRDTLGVLFHWMYGIVIVGSIFACCRRHLRGANPVVAAAVFYLSGMIAWESTSGFIDLGLTCFSFLAFFSFLNWLESPSVGGWLVLGGIFCGFAAGSKYTGVLVLLTLLALVIGAGLRKPQRAKGAFWRAPLAFGLSAAVVAAPWYLKNALETGDPVYPFLVALGGHGAWHELLGRLFGESGMGKGLKDLALLPFRLTFAGDAFGKSQLLGPLYLSCLPFLAVLTKRSATTWWVTGFLLVYTLLWFLTGQNVRFLLPAVPVAACGCALVLGTLKQYKPLVAPIAMGGLLLASGVGFLTTLGYNSQFFPVVFGVETKEAFLARKTWFYDDIQWMNQHLPREARVLFLARSAYYLERRHVNAPVDLSTNGIAEWVDIQREGLPAFVTHRGITHVYCVGQGCLDVCGSGMPHHVLRENDVTLVKSRLLGGTHGQVKTAILELHV